MKKTFIVSSRYLIGAVVTALLIAVQSTLVLGQNSSATDQGTPSALERGSHPLGSFSTSDIDSVNLFNGNLSIAIPVAGKDGRAGHSVAVQLTYNSKIWRTEGSPDGSGGMVYSALLDPWESQIEEIARGWKLYPGRLQARRSGKGQTTQFCGPGPAKSLYTDTLTTITFAAPNGTEYQFRDAKFDGQFRPYSQVCIGETRGIKWYTTDGSAATFISDADDITDSAVIGEASELMLNGTVYLRDGTRFKVTNNRIAYEQDANGNRINYSYGTILGGGTFWKIQDTLGRVVTVRYFSTAQISTETVIAEVETKDANGNSRITRIFGNLLGGALRDGGSVPTYGEIFPSLQNTGNVNPVVVTKVELPADSHAAPYTYQFLYNRYAEVSRVLSPMGGRVDYEYVEGESDLNDDGSGVVIGPNGSLQIYRRVKSRATYLDTTTSTFATKVSYDEVRVLDTSTNPDSYDIEVTEKHRNLDNSINAATRHIFEGTPLDGYARSYGEPAYSGYKPWKEGKELRTEYLSEGATTLLKAVDYEWEQWQSTWANPNPSDKNDLHQFENNPRVKSQTTTVKDSGTTLKSKIVYEYDDLVDGSVNYTFNNVKTVKEFDFGVGNPGGLLRLTEYVYETSQTYTTPVHNTYAASDMVHIRSLVKSETIKNGALAAETVTTSTYDEYGTGYYAPLLTRSVATNSDGTERHHAPYNGTTRPYRGNLTTITYGSGTTDEAKTRYRYDVCGNIVKAWSPRATSSATNLFSTDYDYGSGFSFAYVTGVSRYVTETVGGSPSVKTLSSSTDYFLETGQIKSVTGENGEVTTYDYGDVLSRLTEIHLPTGGYTTVEYSDPGSGDQWVLTTEKLDVQMSQTRETWSKTTFDGLGRTRLNERNDVGVAVVSTETEYDVRGRIAMVSNPKRSTESAFVPTRGWTKTSYDALSRVRFVDSLTDKFDSPISSGFTGRIETIYTDPPDGGHPQVRIRDQAQKEKSSVIDGLGRLASIKEHLDASGSNFKLTSYVYDARGNLKSVTQGVQAARTFTYDSLSRLVQSVMPECGPFNATTGSTTFTYDKASNPLTKTDPRFTTTFTYDELNRPLTRNYSNTTAVDVAYVYDGSDLPAGVSAPAFTRANNNGRLFAVTTAATTETNQEQTGSFYRYDSSGRVIDYSQLVGGQHYRSTPSYNEADLPSTESYSFPGSSNATREYQYNETGQIQTVLRGGAIMAGGIEYSPAGSIRSQRLGDPGNPSSLYHTITYNSRLQPTSILLGTTSGGSDRLDLKYVYGTQPSALAAGASINTKENNGNIARMLITPVPGQPYFEQNYAYDPLNRLLSAREFRTTSGGTGCGGVSAPATPTSLAGSPSGLTAQLSWTDNSSDECSFVILRSTVSGGPYTEVGSGPANVTSYNDLNLSPGTYYYRVIARNDAGDSGYSNEVSVGIGCGVNAPSNFNATNINGTLIQLTWTDNSTNETQFVIERRNVTDYQPYADFATVAANTTNYNDTGLVPYKQYQYRIKAVNASCESVWVESNIATAFPSDQAVKLDGFNDYVSPTSSAANTGLNITANITVEAWIVQYDKNVTDIIVSKHKEGASEGGYLLFITNANKVGFVTYSSTGAVNASVVSNDTIPNKEWVHIAGVYKDTKLMVFVNGVKTELVVGTGKGAATSGTAVQIGRTQLADGTPVKHFYGKIDEVRISSYAMYGNNFTPSMSLSVIVPVTKALWRMNDGAGTSAGDATTNGYTATLFNGVVWAAGVQTGYSGRPEAEHEGGDSEEENPANPDAGDEEVGEGSGTRATASATEVWRQDYDYDQWGNMWLKNTTTPAIYKNIVIDTTYHKNRVTSVDGNACTYDNSGNLTQETVAGRTQTYSYDAGNQMYRAVITGQNGGTITYVYDGEGRRVRKIVQSGPTTTYIYNAAGQLVAEFEGTTRAKEYIAGPSGMIASIQDPGTGNEVVEYTTADHLGTPRVVTNAAGSLLARYDYLPFGQDIPNNSLERTASNGYPVPPADSVTQKFTSKVRDSETGLDFFEARYYGSGQGRFTSVDPVMVNEDRLFDPQGINLYAYTRNNPIRFTDKTGRDLDVDGGSEFVSRIALYLKKIAPGTSVDAKGHVKKPGWFRRIVNKLTGHGTGTALVSRLVDSNRVTTIYEGKDVKTHLPSKKPDDIATGAKGPGETRISFDLDAKIPNDEGAAAGVGPYTDLTIALAHELIHAEHDARDGRDFSPAAMLVTINGARYLDIASNDEFRTVGLSGYTRKGDITENQIRSELGFKPRTQYNGPRDLVNLNSLVEKLIR